MPFGAFNQLGLNLGGPQYGALPADSQTAALRQALLAAGLGLMQSGAEGRGISGILPAIGGGIDTFQQAIGQQHDLLGQQARGQMEAARFGMDRERLGMEQRRLELSEEDQARQAEMFNRRIMELDREQLGTQLAQMPLAGMLDSLKKQFPNDPLVAIGESAFLREDFDEVADVAKALVQRRQAAEANPQIAEALLAGDARALAQIPGQDYPELYRLLLGKQGLELEGARERRIASTPQGQQGMDLPTMATVLSNLRTREDQIEERLLRESDALLDRESRRERGLNTIIMADERERILAEREKIPELARQQALEEVRMDSELAQRLIGELGGQQVSATGGTPMDDKRLAETAKQKGFSAEDAFKGFLSEGWSRERALAAIQAVYFGAP